MAVNRREFLQVGAVGLAAALTGGCVPRNALQVRFRGLLLLEKLDHRGVLHVVDSTALSGIPNHRAVVRIRKSALDLSANNLEPSRKTEENTTKETWEWNLTKGMQVRFHGQEPTTDALNYEVSRPTLPSPGQGGTWKSTLLVPHLKTLTGATKITKVGASVVDINLRDGQLWADHPLSASGPEVVWTFKNPGNNQTLLAQALSDTLLYWSPLHGEPPTVRIDAGTISLLSGKSEFVSIENMMDPPPVSGPNAPFSLGHFEAFYQLIDTAIVPTVTATPPNPGACAKCDVDPFYCPPAVF